AKMDAHLVFAGVGREQQSLENLVRKLGLEKKTTFVGGLNRQELPLIYNLGNVFVIPSTAELQSIVTMEAMATGLPIIGANAGALPELVHDGENGYVHTPGNSQEVADKILRILGDPALAKRMGQKSMEIVKHHSFDEVIKVFEGVYSKVLAKKPS